MSTATIDIVLNDPVSPIAPEIYGHFMEHLGACIDTGCWVGEDSPIGNTGGIRNDVIEALKAVRPPVVRWPGGCFADDYHWKDGIGPRAQRPRRVNMHWGNVIEPNEFGTHEFLAFCRSLGAEPYLCGNVGSGTPAELRDWVEYCNFDGDSTLARERAANGAPAPFGVRYWGVGNENWGCGGHFTPEDYASEYRRFSTYLRNWGGTRLFLIACGPNSNDLDWTRRFFTKLRKDYGREPALHGFSAHYYTWNAGGQYGTATEYTGEQWYGLLADSLQIEPLIVQQRALMDAFDPERKIGLILDEWGSWHPTTPGRNSAFLWQQNTVRDAVLAGLALNIFNRHADKVAMANIAQTINVLQALLLTEEDRMVKTPTYHVYDLYAPHQGGLAVRTLAETPSRLTHYASNRSCELPQVSASASLRASVLTVTLVNTSATEPAEVDLRLSSGAFGAIDPVIGLSAQGDICAHNSFDSPEVVTLQTQAPASPDGPARLRCTLPAASVCRVTATLGE